jgi:methylase of polypeptide subunit release factors
MQSAADIAALSARAIFADRERRSETRRASEPLNLGDSEGLAQFYEALKNSGYPGSGGDRAVARELGTLHRKRDLPLFLRRLQGSESLKTFSRMFAFQASVPRAEARQAFAPLDLDRAAELGIIRFSGDEVEPAVAVSEFDGLFIVHDPALRETRHGVQAEHVLGISPPTLLLASLTLRRPSELALDLGTGCGVQALAMARHCGRVIGTDINRRALNFAQFNAALNGIENVEFRFGSLFEPVAGMRFSLIVTNPPYVISPESSVMFRDGGASADQFCERLVRELPQWLEEDGYACLLANWAHFQEEHWSAPVRRWLEGNGCDAWLLHGHEHEPLDYAGDWNRHLEREAYERALTEWTEYYARLGIRSISSGGLVMRRRTSAQHWLRAEEATERVPRLSEFIESVFARQDFLAAASDEELLDSRFEVQPNHRIVQMVLPENGEYAVREMHLESTEELPFRASLDPTTLELLRRCNGRERLRETLAEVSRLAGAEAEEGRARGLAIVRGLVAHGVLARCKEEKN